MSVKSFDTFTRQLELTANNWPTSRVETINQPLSTAYEVAARTAIDEVAESQPDLPGTLTNHNARHGAAVICRYLKYSAVAAKREGYQLDELSDFMNQPNSFLPLATIASNPNDLAYRTEIDYGLGRPASEQLLYISNKYQIKDGAMTLVGLSSALAIHQYQIEMDGVAIYAGECAAKRQQSLEKIYHQFVVICSRDKSLFARSLDHTA